MFVCVLVCGRRHVWAVFVGDSYDGEVVAERPVAGKTSGVHFNLYNNVWGTAVSCHPLKCCSSLI
jgi:hypothetical protein